MDDDIGIRIAAEHPLFCGIHNVMGFGQTEALVQIDMHLRHQGVTRDAGTQPVDIANTGIVQNGRGDAVAVVIGSGCIQQVVGSGF